MLASRSHRRLFGYVPICVSVACELMPLPKQDVAAGSTENRNWRLPIALANSARPYRTMFDSSRAIKTARMLCSLNLTFYEVATV